MEANTKRIAIISMIVKKRAINTGEFKNNMVNNRNTLRIKRERMVKNNIKTIMKMIMRSMKMKTAMKK